MRKIETEIQGRGQMATPPGWLQVIHGLCVMEDELIFLLFLHVLGTLIMQLSDH